MNKKVIAIIGIVILICIIGASTFFLLNRKDQNSIINTNKISDNKKVLVAYFSATNNTKAVAEKVANNLNGDIFEIEPKNEYTSEDLDWTNDKSRVSREHDDENLRNVELKTAKVDNWDSYDTVLIGYPIWWGIAAWPVNNFVKDNDFTGKTVIPFCTSASSEIGQSGELLEKMTKSGDWQKGYRFSSDVSNSEIKKWIDSIK